MSVIKLSELETKENVRGIRMRKVLANKNVEVRNLILSEGELVPEHKVPVDVFFHVMEGKGTILIGDTEHELDEKDFIVCPPNTLMKVMANRGEKFSILNVKTPALNA